MINLGRHDLSSRHVSARLVPGDPAPTAPKVLCSTWNSELQSQPANAFIVTTCERPHIHTPPATTTSLVLPSPLDVPTSQPTSLPRPHPRRHSISLWVLILFSALGVGWLDLTLCIHFLPTIAFCYARSSISYPAFAHPTSPSHTLASLAFGFPAMTFPFLLSPYLRRVCFNRLSQEMFPSRVFGYIEFRLLSYLPPSPSCVIGGYLLLVPLDLFTYRLARQLTGRGAKRTSRRVARNKSWPGRDASAEGEE